MPKMGNLTPLMTSAKTDGADRDEWRTPEWLYKLLDDEFKFDLDPAATDGNAISPYYFTQDDNGLAMPWWGNVFVNPPYSRMKAWVEKGYTEILNNNCNLVVMLIAARTDTVAWWNFIRQGEVRFLKGRLRFGLPLEYIAEQQQKILSGELPPDHKIKTLHSAPFPSAIVVFRKHFYRPGTIYWEVSHKKRR